MTPGPSVTVSAVAGLPEVTAGSDLAALIADAAPDLALELNHGSEERA